MITQKAYVEGLGEYATSTGDLAENVRDLKGRLASVRNEAFARIHTAGKENIGADGTKFAVEFDYFKGEQPVAVKYDKLSLALAKRAGKANRRDRYCCTDSGERYDSSRKKAEKRKGAVLLPRENFIISPFKNPDIFAFFFGDTASETGDDSYFVFNKKQPIQVYLIDKAIVDGKKNPELLENLNGTIVVPYGWFGSLGSRSGLGGDLRDADLHLDRARGVSESAKGTPRQKFQVFIHYTPEQIDCQLKKLAGIRTGNIKISDLEKEVAEVEKFLKTLKQ